MTPAILNFAWALAGGLAAAATWFFTAGQKYAGMQRDLEKARADLNGVGKKYYRLVALLIRWADTDQKREQLADTVEPPK